MRKLLLISFLVANCLCLAAVQRATAGEFHHLHLRTTDRDAAIAWYLEHMGGEAAKVGDLDAVAYGATRLLFLPAGDDLQSNVGSSIDHIGFSFEDLAAKMQGFEDAGVKIVAPIRQLGPIKFAFIEDPWGTRIEVMQDAGHYGFHHIHLHARDPQITLKWFAEHLGSEVTRYFGILPAIRYGDVWILAQPSREEKSPTKGRSVDHIGWLFDDLDAAVADFKRRGVEIDLEPTKFSGGRYAFVTGPAGIRLELVELSTD